MAFYQSQAHPDAPRICNGRQQYGAARMGDALPADCSICTPLHHTQTVYDLARQQQHHQQHYSGSTDAHMPQSHAYSRPFASVSVPHPRCNINMGTPYFSPPPRAALPAHRSRAQPNFDPTYVVPHPYASSKPRSQRVIDKARRCVATVVKHPVGKKVVKTAVLVAAGAAGLEVADDFMDGIGVADYFSSGIDAVATSVSYVDGNDQGLMGGEAETISGNSGMPSNPASAPTGEGASPPPLGGLTSYPSQVAEQEMANMQSMSFYAPLQAAASMSASM